MLRKKQHFFSRSMEINILENTLKAGSQHFNVMIIVEFQIQCGGELQHIQFVTDQILSDCAVLEHHYNFIIYCLKMFE